MQQIVNYYDENGAVTSSDTVEVVEAPEIQLRSQLATLWDAMAAALPVLQRAQLRQVKLTVINALETGDFDEAAALIAAQTVPAEFQATQAQAVAMLNAAGGAT